MRTTAIHTARRWALSFTLIGLLLLPACATAKDIFRKVDDVAVIACELFGQEHPAEFARMVRSALPPGAADDAERNGFDPRVLCGLKEIVQPFIDSQLRLQQSTAAGVRAGMGE